MSFVPPPPPIPTSVFLKRFDELKKKLGRNPTMAELDPELWRWHTSNQRFFRFASILLGLSAIIIAAVLLWWSVRV